MRVMDSVALYHLRSCQSVATLLGKFSVCGCLPGQYFPQLCCSVETQLQDSARRQQKNLHPKESRVRTCKCTSID